VLEIMEYLRVNLTMERYNQYIHWNLRIEIKHGLNYVLCFFHFEHRMISYSITKCLVSWASVSSIRILKITRADCYHSINNLEPNQACQLEDSPSSTALNISISFFNGYMENKGKLAPKSTKDDAGILGSEASGYIDSIDMVQLRRPYINLRT